MKSKIVNLSLQNMWSKEICIYIYQQFYIQEGGSLFVKLSSFLMQSSRREVAI